MDEEPILNEYEDTEEAEENLSHADQILSLEKQYNDLLNHIRATR